MNITDVGHLTDDADSGEDKMEKKAIDDRKTVWDIAKFYTDDFFNAMKMLNVQKPDIICKATDHIAEMIKLIRQIERNGYSYKISDGIYFDTSKLTDYGKLARLNNDGRDTSRRVSTQHARIEPNPEKKNPSDFALWKFTPSGVKRQMEWDSPWSSHTPPNRPARTSGGRTVGSPAPPNRLVAGKGFPGWHIECTAMAVRYFGTNIDIHTGGIDHIPVHHTNEIAQSQGAYGRDIVKFWLHNEFIMVNGEKMSKSKKNFYRLDDVAKRGFDPMSIRYLFLQAHYRTSVNFTWRGLESAQNGLSNLRQIIQKSTPKAFGAKFKIDDNNQYYISFKDAINDDLNTANGLAVLWEVLRDNQISDEDKLALVLDFDKVLGLGLADIKLRQDFRIPPAIKKFAKEREKARKNKNFALADKLRTKIEEQGFKVEDIGKESVIKSNA